jgi:hypothetical protein
MGTHKGFATPFFCRRSMMATLPTTFRGAGTGEPPPSYGAVDRSIDFGVPFWEGTVRRIWLR